MIDDEMAARVRAKRAQEDEVLHDLLSGAITSGRVLFYTDSRILDANDSPVRNQWDHLAPLLGLMFLALVILLATGEVGIGIVAMTFGVLIHLYGNRHLVAWLIRRRTMALMLNSPGNWMAMWQRGGIALVLKDTPEPPCLAPQGDWRKFTRRNIPAEGPSPAPPPAAGGEDAQEILPP